MLCPPVMSNWQQQFKFRHLSLLDKQEAAAYNLIIQPSAAVTQA